MDGGDAPNPVTVQGDVINISSDVNTDRVMARISEQSERVMARLSELATMMDMLNTPDTGRISRVQSDGDVTSSSEGTSALPAEGEVMIAYRKKVEEVFNFEGECSFIHKTSSLRLLQSEKFDDVLTSMKTKIDLGPELMYAHQLVSYIITLMLANSSEDNSQLRKELFELIRNKLNLPGRAVKSLADDFRIESKYFEAILLFLVAWEFHANEVDGVNSAKEMVGCCLGVMHAALGLIQNESVSNIVVMKQILPLFNELGKKIQGMKGLDKENKTDCEACCRCCVATINVYLKEYESAEESCKVGVEMMESRLPLRYIKHKVYGALWCNWGSSYIGRQQRPDAKKCWRKAVEAWKTAEGFVSENERKEAIKYVKILLGETAE